MESAVPLDYRKMTVAQLKEELSSRGLGAVGKKVDLISKLEEHDLLLAEEEEAELLEGDGGEEELGMEEEVRADNDEAQHNGAEDMGGEEAEEHDESQIPMGTDITGEEEEGDSEVHGEHGEEAEEAAEEQEEEEQATAEQGEEEQAEEEEQGEEEEAAEEEQEEEEEAAEEEQGEEELSAEVAHGEEEDGGGGDEEGAGEEGVKSEEKEAEAEEVVIDTVGEVDDEEFAAGLDSLSTEKTDSAKDAAVEQEKEDEDKLKSKPPTPPMMLDQWFVKRLTEAKQMSSVYIHPLERSQVLNSVIVDWANRARYFVINFSKSGKGSAILTFSVDEDAESARVALAAELGEEVMLENPKSNQEKDMVKEISYPSLTQFQATRTVALHGVSEDTRLEQIRDLFTSPQLLARVHDNESDYKWKGMSDYTPPAGFTEMVLVEFGSSREAEKAVEQNKEFILDDQKVTTELMTEFESRYTAKFKETMREITQEENRLLQLKKKSSVLLDKDRLAMCRALSNTVKERSKYQRMDSGIPWNDRMTKQQQLSRKVMDLVRALDHDTDKRVGLKMDFPESIELMTKHTRKLHQNMMRRDRRKESTKDSRDSRKDFKLTVKVEGDKREVGKTEDPIVIDDEDEDDGTSVKADIRDTDRKIQVDADGGVKVERKVGGPDSTSVDMEIKSKAGNKTDTRDRKSASKDKGVDKRRSGSERSGSRKGRSRSPERRRSGRSADRREELSPTPERSTKEKRLMEMEIEKLTMDLRGWYSVSIIKPNENWDREDARKVFERYGRLKEIHFTQNKVFLRYAHRGEILRAIKHEFSKYTIEVPNVADKYVHPNEKERVERMKARRRGLVPGGDRGPERARFSERPRDRPGPMPTTGPPVHDVIAPAIQNALVMQQRQQQIMMQQEMLRRQQQQQQQQQAAMAMQASASGNQGLLGPAPIFRGDQGRGQFQMQHSVPQAVAPPQTASGAVPSLLNMARVAPTGPMERRPAKREREPSPRRDNRPRERSRERAYERRDERAYDRKGDRSQHGYDRGDTKSRSDYPTRHEDDYDDRGPKRMKDDERSRSSGGRDRDEYVGSPKADDTSTVAAVLKGLSQVISSKMEEMTRLGGLGSSQQAREMGERLVSETVASISERAESSKYRNEPSYRSDSGRRDESRHRYDRDSRSTRFDRASDRGEAYGDRRDEDSLLGAYSAGGREGSYNRDRSSYGEERRDESRGENRELYAIQQQALRAMADPYDPAVPTGVPPPAKQYGVTERYPALSGGALLPSPDKPQGLLPLPSSGQQRGRQGYDHYGSRI